MTLAHDRYVRARFDALEPRFRGEVSGDDFRVAAIVRGLGPVAGQTILDLGCGKGRFSRRLIDMKARVIGLDASIKMISQANGVDRVRGSASRLPFSRGAFDAVIAVEVLEHLSPEGMAAALDEIRRVLRPTGRVAILDKNLFALDAVRPWLPKVLVKRIDERRGLWMYPSDAPVRERWFRPGRLARDLRERFARVDVEPLLSVEESRHAVFRKVPRTRLMTMWLAHAEGTS